MGEIKLNVRNTAFPTYNLKCYNSIFCNASDGTQGFINSSQVLCQLAMISISFALIILSSILIMSSVFIRREHEILKASPRLCNNTKLLPRLLQIFIW